MSGATGAGANVLERDAELARIEGAVARAQDGHGSLLVVEGPAGIGKSALIGAARALSDAAGARTLRARGGELERDFAFGVVRQLLEPALAEVPARARDDLLQGPAGVAPWRERLVCDATTSGGLLVAVDPARAGELPGAVVGRLTDGDPGAIAVV